MKSIITKTKRGIIFHSSIGKLIFWAVNVVPCLNTNLKFKIQSMVIDNKTYDLTPTKVHVLMSESIWYRFWDHNLFVLQSYFWYHIQSIVKSIRNSININLSLYSYDPLYFPVSFCINTNQYIQYIQIVYGICASL